MIAGPRFIESMTLVQRCPDSGNLSGGLDDWNGKGLGNCGVSANDPPA